MEKCTKCGQYIKRAVSVDAIVIRRGKILLVKRGKNPHKGLWALPGGHVEFNETCEEAALRELREETGMHGKNPKLVGVYSSPRRHPKQIINIPYVVSASGKPVPGDDAAAVGWFDIKKLPEKMAFDHARIIKAYRTRK